jgi:hypothetical protein
MWLDVAEKVWAFTKKHPKSKTGQANNVAQLISLTDSPGSGGVQQLSWI